ncbi:hypothetical protein BJ322DRAFT_611811 [Thelephora terrestris]|uniref:C2H2-type domain-containing protein n=1 Tax=Thelephora terrestris TaxID=56493 RepID=A0A9P6L9L6_9AGAM|nr:hypothetical protein BJ322DRAFT_611811 [Thelephora terrestris]
MSFPLKLTDIPSCMRMSFNFPWEGSPEKEIRDPLSYDPPDVASDFQIIYGEGAAGDLFLQKSFPRTPTKGDNPLPVLQEDSPHAETSPMGFGQEVSPGLQLKAEGPSTPSPGHANGDRKSTKSNARTRRVPYYRRPVDSPFVGPSSLPESHSPAFHPQRPGNPPVNSQPSPSRPSQNFYPNASRRLEAFAHRYCRYPGCDSRFSDKRTTERHRLTHLSFGTYVCPNPACDSRTKSRPHFASSFSLGRHLKLATPGSPCAVGKGHKLSTFKLMDSEDLIQQVLVPFDPAIHTPF